MTVSRQEEGDTVTIKVEGRFDFGVHQAFLEAYCDQPKGERKFIVDLARTDYMDSSAMGMLLQLRGHARPDQEIELKNGGDGVKEILRIANFDKLFAVV